MSERTDVKKTAELLRSMAGKKVLILCHRRPDGDTLGSALALEGILISFGCRADIACCDAVPANCKFLFEGRRPPLSRPTADDYDVITAVDVASRSQLGELSPLSDKVFLRIDHHAVGEDYAKYNCVYPDAPATGEIMLGIADELGVDTKLIAEPVYAAISSDTGGFRYPNTRGETMMAGARLIECGIDLGAINHYLFDNHTKSEIRAIRTAYGNIRYHADGKIAVITVTKEDKEKNDLSDDDLGSLNSLARDIDGVLLGIVLKQEGENASYYRVSMRSVDPIDVSLICQKLGGGGHARAAGGEVNADTPEKAESTVLDTVMKEQGRFFE